MTAYPTLEALLYKPSVDLVVCATPNDTYKEFVIRTLNAGKDIIFEKLATMAASDFDEITEAAQQANRLLTVDQSRRWDEGFL